MKLDQVFGVLLILLAIYLAIDTRPDAQADGGGLFDEDGAGLFSDGESADSSGDGGEGDGGEIVVDEDGGENADDTTSDEQSDEQKDKMKAEARKDKDDSVDGEVADSDFCANVDDTSQFDDVGPIYDDAVQCMEAADVVEGVSDDTYAPGDALRRAQAAATIAALIDSANGLERSGVDLAELPEAPDNQFDDVPADMPEADAIAQLNEAGILQGYVDRRYEPDGRVTRAQMASILDRTYKFMTGEALPGGSDQFSDDSRSVHQESINAVAAADIMHGVDGRFEPHLKVKRGPMAQYAARMMIRLEETGRIRPLE